MVMNKVMLLFMCHGIIGILLQLCELDVIPRRIGWSEQKEDRDKNIQHQGFAGGHPPNY